MGLHAPIWSSHKRRHVPAHEQVITPVNRKWQGDHRRIHREGAEIATCIFMSGIPRGQCVCQQRVGTKVMFDSQQQVKGDLGEGLCESEQKEERGWHIKCHTRILDSVAPHQMKIPSEDRNTCSESELRRKRYHSPKLLDPHSARSHSLLV